MKLKGTHIDVTDKTRDQWHDFTLRLVNMQHEAMRLGLIRTSHAVHDAVKAHGWELADFTGQIAKAAR